MFNPLSYQTGLLYVQENDKEVGAEHIEYLQPKQNITYLIAHTVEFI
jgi:hypothetical protein